MIIDLDVNTAEPSAWIRSVWKDQLPFATSRAINRVALAGQAAERTHMKTIFHIRRPGFVLGGVKISPFARKDSLFAIVKVDPPGGQARADILTKFETKTTKTPFRGNRIWIPTGAVPRTPTGIIRKGWRPKDLGPWTQHGKGKALARRGSVFRGRQGIYSILQPGGKGIIARSKGGSSRGEILYVSRPVVRINPNLQFIANVSKAVLKEWVPAFNAEFLNAMRTARSPRIGPSIRALGGLARAI